MCRSKAIPIKPPAALEEFLRRHPHVVRMETVPGQRPARRTATAALAEHYGKQYALTIRFAATRRADYGDLAQMAMRQKALKRERAEICPVKGEKVSKKSKQKYAP